MQMKSSMSKGLTEILCLLLLFHLLLYLPGEGLDLLLCLARAGRLRRGDAEREEPRRRGRRRRLSRRWEMVGMYAVGFGWLRGRLSGARGGVPA